MLLGVDLGGTNIRIGQIEGTKIVARISEPSPSDMSVADSLDRLETHIRGMMDARVEGVGIGVPSVVDVERGVVYNATNIPSWREVHLKEELEARLGVPVYVNNDANAFALGESVYGSARGFRHVVGVTLGTGVGAGIVVNGALYAGRNTGAGEIGSLPYLDATLEDYCGSNFFARRHSTTGREAARRAMAGDAEAMAIWNEFGEHMGELMKIVLFVYDPEAVLFGGGITASWELFEGAMRRRMEGFPYPETVRNIHIAPSTDPDIQILGAAALAAGKITSY